jgi:hypothetical protein
MKLSIFEVLVPASFLVLKKNIKADDALYADLAEPIAVLKIGIIMQRIGSYNAAKMLLS